MTNSDGSKYDGEFKEDKRHGTGTLTDPDGSIIYNGEWEKGKMHGNGILTAPNGNTYNGSFKEGKTRPIQMATNMREFLKTASLTAKAYTPI